MQERVKILNMLSEGKISVEQAEALLSALQTGGAPVANVSTEQAKAAPSYLYVVVEPKEGSAKKEKVNVRIPLKLLKAGMKFASLVPDHVQDKVDGAMKEKGVNFDWKNMDANNVDEFLATFGDLSIDVDSGEEMVRVYCE